MTYKEKLLDPRWQKKRLEILNRDNWECSICHCKKKTLHIHHKKYLPNCDPWDYENKLLQTLCYECHEFVQSETDCASHDIVEIMKERFSFAGMYAIAKSIDKINIEKEDDDYAFAIASLISNTELMKNEIIKKKHDDANSIGYGMPCNCFNDHENCNEKCEYWDKDRGNK